MAAMFLVRYHHLAALEAPTATYRLLTGPAAEYAQPPQSAASDNLSYDPHIGRMIQFLAAINGSQTQTLL